MEDINLEKEEKAKNNKIISKFKIEKSGFCLKISL